MHIHYKFYTPTQQCQLLCFFAIIIATIPIFGTPAPATTDPSLVVHYTFDQNTGEIATDHGEHQYHGKVLNAEYHANLDGRTGVLRLLDDPDSYISLGANDQYEKLALEGDVTVEMRIKQYAYPSKEAGIVFSETGKESFTLNVVGWLGLTLYLRTQDPTYGIENSTLPFARRAIDNEWTHVALVFEYPRCRFYINGRMVQDRLMPFALTSLGNYEKRIGGNMPLDIDEFRLYRRALAPAEIRAHHLGQEIKPVKFSELFLRPDWYGHQVGLTLSCRGVDYSNHVANITFRSGDRSKITQSVHTRFEAYSPGRFVALASVPLDVLAAKKYVDIEAKVLTGSGKPIETIRHHAFLEKPVWVDTPEGHTDTVLDPWTPLVAESRANGVSIASWNRRYDFFDSPLPQQFTTGENELLTAPPQLIAKIDGRTIDWNGSRTRLIQSTDTAATTEYQKQSAGLTLAMRTVTEFDGHTIYDCRITARRTTTFDSLSLNIPFKKEFSQFCTAEYARPQTDRAMDEFFFDGIKKDLAFRAAPVVWIGGPAHGLSWELESNEHWHNAEEFQAIEILPRGDTTLFHARFIDVPTTLDAGDSLHYRFSLQATPIKPQGRDGWDLRLTRAEPYGADLDWPLKYRGDGLSHMDAMVQENDIYFLFTNVSDRWAHSLPQVEMFQLALKRLMDFGHSAELRMVDYQIHQRYPLDTAEWETHGTYMFKRPLRWYANTGVSADLDHPRPGPITHSYGADSQGAMQHCNKSPALRDAALYMLARRLDIYGDDGVYLDGSNAAPPCMNQEHGCGYRGSDGKMKVTYPVFASRQFMKRLYVIVKSRRPDNVVDLHSSFFFNPSAIAYSDVLWTGEQWHHLRGRGAKHIPDELTFDRFHAQFTGIQSGVAINTLAYRLGTQIDVSAVTLLFDVPTRPSTGNYDQIRRDRTARPTANENYFERITAFWKLRRRQFNPDGQASKHFFFENAEYVRVQPERCHATLLVHPQNGTLVLVSNLSRETRDVAVELDLAKLGLEGRDLRAFDVFTDEKLPLDADGSFRLSLNKLGWTYIWIKPQ